MNMRNELTEQREPNGDKPVVADQMSLLRS
jgi:hypothetical protein